MEELKERIVKWYEKIRSKLKGEDAKESISYQLLPIIRLTSLFGNRPISATTFTNKFGNKSVNYSLPYSFKSWLISPTLFLGIPTFLLWILFFVNVGLSIDTNEKLGFRRINFPGHNFSKLNYLVIRGLCLMISIVRIVETLAMWTSTRSLSHVLNSWNDIDNDLIVTFRKFNSLAVKDVSGGNGAKINIIQNRNLLLILYVIIPTIGFFPFVIKNESFMLVGIHSTLATAISMYLLSSGITLALLEDANVGIMYKCLAESFKQVKLEIANILKLQLVQKGICHEDIRDWNRIILKIRKQCELVGNNQAFHQLIPLAIHVVWLSLSLFILVQNIAYDVVMVDEHYGITDLCIGSTVSLVIRLLLQVTFAVEITREEEALAISLFEIHGQISDVAIKMEVKNIFDLLMMRPSRISFWDYVIINPAFLLGFVSQVTTIFIVLTQFNGNL